MSPIRPRKEVERPYWRGSVVAIEIPNTCTEPTKLFHSLRWLFIRSMRTDRLLSKDEDEKTAFARKSRSNLIEYVNVITAEALHMNFIGLARPVYGVYRLLFWSSSLKVMSMVISEGQCLPARVRSSAGISHP